MKKRLCIIVLLALISACGSFNKGTAELHINKNVTTGQELMDLQTALDKDIITQEEFDALVGKEETKNRLNGIIPFLKGLSQMVIINIGIAGGNPKNTILGEIYLIRSITDDESHELVFPDRLENHSFNEIELTTVSKGVKDYGKQFDGLVDMEASVIYEVMTKKISPYRMVFLKVVSDHMDSADWTSIDATGLIVKHLNSIKTHVIKAI